MAVLAVLDSTLFMWQPVTVEVELCGDLRGMTRIMPAFSPTPIQVAIGVDVEKCRHLIYAYLSNTH
jgi:inosine-uridine nucleoside N-ribohydrolase